MTQSTQTRRTPGINAPQPLAAPADDTEDIVLAIVPYYILAFLLIVGAAALVLVVLFEPTWAQALLSSLSGSEPKAYWYMARAGGLVSFGMIWLSMVLGLMITNKLGRLWPGGPTIVAMHNYTGLLGMALGVFHGLILLGDQYIGYTLVQILVPFSNTTYRPLWVGLGQISLYLAALSGLTFYLRRWISYRAWRVLHFLTFGVFAMTLVHGLMSGTDSSLVWVRDMYWASFVSVAGLTVYRIIQARADKQAKAKKLAAA